MLPHPSDKNKNVTRMGHPIEVRSETKGNRRSFCSRCSLRMTEWMGHGASLQNDAGFLLLLLLLLHLLEVDEGDARLWGVLCTLDQHTPVFRNGQLSV